MISIMRKNSQTLDLEAVKQDLHKLMTDHRIGGLQILVTMVPFYPYGLHSAGTYRVTDGRGGWLWLVSNVSPRLTAGR